MYSQATASAPQVPIARAATSKHPRHCVRISALCLCLDITPSFVFTLFAYYIRPGLLYAGAHASVPSSISAHCSHSHPLCAASRCRSAVLLGPYCVYRGTGAESEYETERERQSIESSPVITALRVSIVSMSCHWCETQWIGWTRTRTTPQCKRLCTCWNACLSWPYR